MIPVIISLIHRTQYLPYMFNSLLASELSNVKLFIHSNKDFPQLFHSVDYHYPLQDAVKQLGIEQIKGSIHPYSNFCEIFVSNQNTIHIQKVKAILDYYFTSLDTDFIIYLKDDIVFNKDWLSNLLSVYAKTKADLGFIAGCDLNTHIYTPDYLQSKQNVQRGYIECKTKQHGRYGSSQCYLIARQFYNKWKNTKLNDRLNYSSTFNQASDFILNEACCSLGLKNYLTTPQFIEHIGAKSGYKRKGMPLTHLFIKPFCYGDFINVKKWIVKNDIG